MWPVFHEMVNSTVAKSIHNAFIKKIYVSFVICRHHISTILSVRPNRILQSNVPQPTFVFRCSIKAYPRDCEIGNQEGERKILFSLSFIRSVNT